MAHIKRPGADEIEDDEALGFPGFQQAVMGFAHDAVAVQRQIEIGGVIENLRLIALRVIALVFGADEAAQ